MAGGPAWVRGGSSGQPGIGPPTASSQTSALAPTATPGLSAWTHLVWRDASAAFVGVSRIVAGTSWSGGYVLVGETGAAGADGAIWYSPDGRTWQQGAESNRAGFEGMRFLAVAASGGRLVAVAESEVGLTVAPTAVIWYSTDGAVWYPSPIDQDVFNAGIAAGPHGFVIYGTAPFPARPTMLYSTDGVRWAQTTIPNAVDGSTVTSVLATSDGFAAVGGSQTSTPGTGGPGAAWWSPDGQTWHAGAVDSADPLYGLVRWANGELRASSSTQKCCVSSGMPVVTTWSSADGGHSWRSIGYGLVPVGDATIYDEGRLVRLQTQATPWATWSSDGVAWLPLRMDGASPITGSHLIVANGDTLIATGTRPPGSGGSRTEVLIGQLDDQPGPAPTPTIVPGSQDTPCKGTNPCGP